MWFSRSLLVFCFGLFAIVAQTLLFREYINAFDSNDLAVGIFFGSWFAWVGAGAWCCYRRKRPVEWGAVRFLAFAYLPAFGVEVALILYIRDLAAVKDYEVFPLQSMCLWSLLVNAPVSLVTGALFLAACRWLKDSCPLPVAFVFVIEALGSFGGGLGATFLLASGMTLVTISLIAALVLSCAICHTDFCHSRRLWTGVIPALILACLALGWQDRLEHGIRLAKWQRLYPAASYLGVFHTPQSEYLYGVYRGQWLIVREGSVWDALPAGEAESAVVAVHLCQNPGARRVLLIGSGLGICQKFLTLPHIEKIVWAHTDPAYASALTFLPRSADDRRLVALRQDAREFLRHCHKEFDIVVVNLPDATSAILNRYATVEFFRQVQNALADGGIVGVRASSGENAIGEELANLGASTERTLLEVFSHCALKPGEETWFIAADHDGISDDPAVLAGRFDSIAGAEAVLPSAHIRTLYVQERAEAARQAYRAVELPDSLLLNRDRRPLAHLYGLLVAARRSDAPITRFIRALSLAGIWPFLVPVAVFAVLRVLYLLVRPPSGEPSGFDPVFLVLSTGGVAIATVIVLMYLYQTVMGSLYLYAGFMSSLFMVGLSAGGTAANFCLSREARPQFLSLAVIAVHLAFLYWVGGTPLEEWRISSFTLAFAGSGLCAGAYFPIAASLFKSMGKDTGEAAVNLEVSDHLGAALGGFVTSLIAMPVLGTQATLVVIGAVLSANAPIAIVHLAQSGPALYSRAPLYRRRRIGYVLFGAAAIAVFCSNLLFCHQSPAPEVEMRFLAEGMRAEREKIILARGEFPYFKLYDSGGEFQGYVFSSADLAPEVTGYGGKISLAVRTDAAGNLTAFHVLRSQETPAYLALLAEWLKNLPGKNVFGKNPFASVDAVSGATMSSKAILSAIEKSGQRFAASALGQEKAAERNSAWSDLLPDPEGTYLMAALLIALILVYLGSGRDRTVFLCSTLLVGGVLLNTQFSSIQVLGLLSWQFPQVSLSGPFLLIVAVPFSAFLFGNVYCGYVCPFGALQELSGYLLPGKIKPASSGPSAYNARFIKYVLLFVLVASYFLYRRQPSLAADPLVEVFSRARREAITAAAGIALLCSLFYFRFWCRFLCPAGAFLSLVGARPLLKRLLPERPFHNCEYGITAHAQIDCLVCDRCRHAPEVMQEEVLLPGARKFGYLLPLAVAVALVICAISASRWGDAPGVAATPGNTPSESAPALQPLGSPRDVDLEKIRSMIRHKKLSDHEAMFYKKLEK